MPKAVMRIATEPDADWAPGARSSPRAGELCFGPFRLIPHERRLERNGVPVPLGGRALDILVALVERHGRVVGKAELSRIVWPDMIVEEGSLRFHIVSLRKALGESAQQGRYLTTVAGRGYCFTGMTLPEPAGTTPVQGSSKPGLPGLPFHPHRIIGMAEMAADAAAELTARRFLTLVGPPGIGKTTLAIQLGHQLENLFPDGVAFLELGGVSSPNLLLNAVAGAIGRTPPTDHALENLLPMLRDRRMLLIFDTCEHLIDAVADLTEQLFQRLPALSILTTSRESLRVEGEHVYRLYPLPCPPENPAPSAAEARAYPAVELFVDKLQAGQIGFQLTDKDAPALAEICRRLDGIPLALELAAGRVPAYGIRQTARLLEGHLRLLWQGRRTAPPRQQTLSAALDWSYDLLPAAERIVLRRISVFVGAFTLDAAIAVASTTEQDTDTVMQALANLVAKSLLILEERPCRTRYRLLETTRVYALAKLLASEEAPQVVRRHAVFFCELLSHEEALDVFFHTPKENPYDNEIGNIRAALQWSFSASGDPDLAASLAVVTAPLFLDLFLPVECRFWVEKGLEVLSATELGGSAKMQLQACHGLALLAIGGNEQAAEAAFRRGFDLARQLSDPYHQLRFLGGLHILWLRFGDFSRSLAVVEQAREIAMVFGDAAAISMVEAMLTVAHQLAGNHLQSRAHLAAAAAEPPALPRSANMQLGIDHRSRVQCVLARDLWIRGHSLAALHAAHDAIEDAARLDHPLAYSISLVFNTSVFFWLDDLDAAENAVMRLVAHAQKHGLARYAAAGEALQGMLDLRHGRLQNGAARISAALRELKRQRFGVTTAGFMGALAECQAGLGLRAEAISTLDEALAAVARNGDRFHMPELLRLKGEILATGPVADLHGAERCLRDALNWARLQSAPALELKAAISLARVRIARGTPGGAASILDAALGGLVSPAGSKDHRIGTELLRRLRRPTLTLPHKI